MGGNLETDPSPPPSGTEVTTLVGSETVNNDLNVQAVRSLLIDIGGATSISDDVQGRFTTTVRVREGALVTGNIQLLSAFATSGDALVVDTVTVEGDIQAQTSRGGLRVVDRIGGNIQFVNNTGGSYETTGNEVDGDIQLFDNRGNGIIRGNTVQGNLQNKQNLPPPTVENNIVSGDVELDESSRTGPMLLLLQDGS